MFKFYHRFICAVITFAEWKNILFFFEWLKIFLQYLGKRKSNTCFAWRGLLNNNLHIKQTIWSILLQQKGYKFKNDFRIDFVSWFKLDWEGRIINQTYRFKIKLSKIKFFKTLNSLLKKEAMLHEQFLCLERGSWIYLNNNLFTKVAKRNDANKV